MAAAKVMRPRFVGRIKTTRWFFGLRSIRPAVSSSSTAVCIVCLVTWVSRASSDVESSGLVSNTLRITYS